MSYITWHTLFKRLDEIEQRITMNQTELAAALTLAAAAAQSQAEIVGKISAETTALLDAIAVLQAELKNAGNTTPEVDAALAALGAATDSLTAALRAVDEKVPDAV
jgi:hypothetical protein